MSEHHNTIRQVADAISVATVVATFMEILPPIAALFTIVWTSIQIYESETVQYWLKKRKEKKDGGPEET